MDVLRSAKFNIDWVICNAHPLPLIFGSEFRPVDKLECIFYLHPSWPCIQLLLTQGSDWPLKPLEETDRQCNVAAALKSGNHKGALDHPDLLHKLVKADVEFGYAIPLLLDSINKIPGVLLAPLNIIWQNTIDEHGPVIKKDWLTHYQSYCWDSATLVNSCVKWKELVPCLFGAVLKQLINWAVAAWACFLHAEILAAKFDFQHAFWHLQVSLRIALQTCTQLQENHLAIMSLCLPFGVAPGPLEWGIISEAICNLDRTLLQDRTWDPGTVHLPELAFVPKTSQPDLTEPLAQA